MKPWHPDSIKQANATFYSIQTKTWSLFKNILGARVMDNYLYRQKTLNTAIWISYLGLSSMKDDNEITQKAEIMYRMLCMNKEASIKYLSEVGKICKIDNPSERKTAYNALFADLVQGITQTKKR